MKSQTKASEVVVNTPMRDAPVFTPDLGPYRELGVFKFDQTASAKDIERLIQVLELAGYSLEMK